MAVPASPNRLLALLPEDERQPLVTGAETVSLRPHEELYPTAGPIENVYFPLNMAASILIEDGQGEAVEIAIVGNEGMLGSAVVLGIPRMPELDGPGFFQELQRRHPHLCARVVFLTGDTFSPAVLTFLEHTGAPQLTKPVTAEMVRQIIQHSECRLREHQTQSCTCLCLVLTLSLV